MEFSYGIKSFNTTPTKLSSGSFTLGIAFKVLEEKTAVGLRVYSSSTSNTVTLDLWGPSHNVLATVSGNKKPGGWTEFLFNEPIVISPNTEYRISVFTHGGSYEAFENSIVTEEGFDYLGACYGSSHSYPATSYSVFYGIDIIFEAGEKLLKKYLIKEGSTFYTISDGDLLSLPISEALSTSFIEYGFDDITDLNSILSLPDPEILYWQNSNEEDLPELKATVTAIPFPQVIISDKIMITDDSITGIERVFVDCEGDPLFSVSFDDKQTWYVWNGTQWSQVSEELSGMSKELFESITYNDWLRFYTEIDGFYIKVILTSSSQSVTKIFVDFAN